MNTRRNACIISLMFNVYDIGYFLKIISLCINHYLGSYTDMS